MTAWVVLAGEVVAQSDGITSRVDSAGRRVTVLLAASTLDHMRNFGVALEAAYGDFAAAQNQTLFEVSQTKSTASCAKSNSWTDERFNAISDTLSTWPQFLIFSRPVFFGPLDDGMTASFATLIFGCAAILFLNVHIPDVVVAAPNSSGSSAKAGSKEEQPDDSLPHEHSSADGNESVQLNAIFSPFTGVNEEDKSDFSGSRSSNKLSNVFALPVTPTEAHESGAFSRAVVEEDSAVLLCQDPESISSNLKGDVDRFQRLYRFAWLQLQPTVVALKADPDEPNSKLIERAAEYANLAAQGFFVYTLVLTEQRYGRDSLQCKVFRWLNGLMAFGMRKVFIVLFLLTAFLPSNSTEQCVLDIISLTMISCFTAAWAFYQWVQLSGDRLRASTWVHIVFLGLAWVALVLQQLGVVSILGLMRPWPLLLSSETLRDTLMVFSICVGDISTILAFGFFSVCASAIPLFVLYKDKLDGGHGGTILDSFLDSFIATFIFMESGDNWESLVYNIYKVSKAGAILLLLVATFGTLFLVTLVTLRVVI